MASLPNNTFASPGNPYYAPIGSGGAASSLQSPASIVPDAAQGDAILNVNSAGGASYAALSVIGGPTADGDIGLGGGGFIYDFKAAGLSGNLTIGVSPAQVNQGPLLSYSHQAGALILGDNLPAGKVLTNQPLQVQGNPANGNAVQIQATSGTAANIFNTVTQGGGLILGSSAACPAVLAVVDTAGAGTQFVSVGAGGSGGNVRLQGASAGYPAPLISNNNAGPATFNIGASANAPQLIYLTDPTGVADQAYVDITKGTANGVGLRLQGYGGGTAATVSTNLGTNGGGVLNVTSGYNDATSAVSINDTEVVTNRQLVLRGSNGPTANWTGPGAPSGTPNIVLRTAQVSGGAFTVDLSPLPSGWALVYGAVIPGATPAINDQAAMFSVMVYTDASNHLTGGGVGGVPGLVTVQPVGTSSLGVNIAAATTANYAIYGITMFAN